MPIHPEDAHRYPDDWPAIARAVKAGAGWRCECEGECGRGTHDGRCPNVHGQPAYGTGSEVVLTVAHLVAPTLLPVRLHVARAAEAEEVVQLVGDLVPIDAERREGDDVVHDRALAEFLAGPSASSARFVVALPRSATGSAPRRAVVADAPARPVWVELADWRLRREPPQAAGVRAEPPTSAQVEARHAVAPAAPLARPLPKPALRAADRLTATGRRAGALAVGRLLRRELHPLAADDAVAELLAAAGPSHAGEVYHVGYLPENCDLRWLRAFCQGCHLHYDREHHAQSRARRRREALEQAGQTTLAPEA